MSDNNLDLAIRQALAKHNASKQDACPDYNALAAYLEGRLARDEREILEEHAAGCLSCQQVLGLAATIDVDSPRTAIVSPLAGKKVLFRLTVPISALALLFVTVAVGILFLRNARSPEVAWKKPQKEIEKPLPPSASPAAPGMSGDVRAVAPAPARPGGAAEEAPKFAMTKKGSASLPQQDMPKRASSDAAVPSAIIAAAEIPATKGEARRLEAAKLEPSPPAGEAAGAGRFERSRSSRDQMGGGVAGGVVGGVQGGIPRAQQPAEVQKVAAFEMVQPAATPRAAILESMRHQGEADVVRWKKIGERGFRYAEGYWIDEQCAKNSDAPITEIKAGMPEFEEMVKLQPELRALLPAVVFRDGKIWVLR